MREGIFMFGIFGADMRMRYLCDLLRADGYAAAQFQGGGEREFIDGCDVIILPPGGYDSLLPLCAGKTVLCGADMKHDGVRAVNYANDPYFKTANALPTAEGAVMLAMENTVSTLRGMRAAVLGPGNIGTVLCGMLVSLGANVTALCRSGKARAAAENLGAVPAPFVPDALRGCAVAFNTVPAPVLDEKMLSALPAGALIVDLASAPGGTDFAAARGLGINAILASGLPGRYAPRTAAGILKRTVLSLMEEINER